jgi:hypothetical protein
MSENNKSVNHPTNIIGPDYENFHVFFKTNKISQFVANFVKVNYEKYDCRMDLLRTAYKVEDFSNTAVSFDDFDFPSSVPNFSDNFKRILSTSYSTNK